MKQEWILCDLHMHSGYSAINKSGDKKKVKKMTAEEWVTIMKDHKVKLFSITDHNYFSKEYYDEIEKYIKANSIDMKFILGAELDTYLHIEDPSHKTEGKDDYIHICFYFDDNTDREKLEQTINKLYKDEKGNPLKPNLSKILDAFYDLKTKYIIVPHGDKTSGLFKIIRNSLITDKPQFYKYAMYKVFNAFDVKPNFYENSIKHWSNIFYERSKGFNEYVSKLSDDQIEELKDKILAKIKNDETELNSDEQKIYEYMLSYGSYFAYFSFSDWHNASPYDPKINNFIFGSLDNPFGTFEMATLDPESRIQVQKETYVDIPSTLLKSVSFKIKGKQKEVQFTPGLNVVIGKRGSGKSLLLSVIHNLADKGSDDGALKRYKSLEVTDISGKNRGNTTISLGSLSSINFLSQNDINDIFDNPENAQEKIRDEFKEIGKLNTSNLEEILSIAKNIKPYNQNYKNVTNNILSSKKTEGYSFGSYTFQYSQNDVQSYFDGAIKNLEEAKIILNSLHLDVTDIDEEITRLKYLQNYYIKLLMKYNAVVNTLNSEIERINADISANQASVKVNRQALNDAVNIMLNNIEIYKNFQKLKIAIKNVKIENPAVEVNRNGQYLFVTYYDIPENLNQQIEEHIAGSISRSSAPWPALRAKCIPSASSAPRA